MNEVRRIGRRFQRQKKALEATHEELAGAIVEARRGGATLRAIAAATGLSYARIFQLTKEKD